MGPGSALSSRPELAETRIVLLRLLPVSILGTIAGAGLLLVTPPVVFARVVPFLVAAGSLVLVLQPTLLRLTGQRHGGRPLLILVSVGVVSVYGGYFGAGSGVMLLADPAVRRFACSARQCDQEHPAGSHIRGGRHRLRRWRPGFGALYSLAVGLLIGSLLGPIIVRHLPPSLVRWIAATLGFVLAIYLWLRPA